MPSQSGTFVTDVHRTRPAPPGAAGALQGPPAPDESPGPRSGEEVVMFNQVALSGRLTRPAAERVLPSGTRLLSLDVTVERPDGPAETIPVVLFDAPGWAATLDVGADVVVVGRIRRRFFRTGGGLQSRTEVLATRVVTTRPLRRARTVLAEAAAALESAAVNVGEPPASGGRHDAVR